MADTSEKSYDYELPLRLILENALQGSWSKHVLEIKNTAELKECLYVEGIEIGTWHKDWELPQIEGITFDNIIRINVGYPHGVKTEERLEKLNKLATLLSNHGAKLLVCEKFPYIAIEIASFIKALDSLPYD